MVEQQEQTQIMMAHRAEANMAQNAQMMAMNAALVALAQSVAELKANKTEPKQKRSPPASTFTPWTYCWTHGGKMRNGHDSKTCRSKADGHQNEATFTNKLNGSTQNCA